MSSSGAALTAADVGALPLPAGAWVDTTTYDNPFGGGGKVPVVVLPADAPVLLVALDGDAYPRLLLPADPGDAVVYASDGTASPLAGAYLSLLGVGDDTRWALYAAAGVQTRGDLAVVAGGLVQTSPNDTPYRLVVANGGALSTVDASIVVTDAFTRANETPLSVAATGQPWVTAFGGGLSVIGNQCGPSTATDRGSVIDPGVDDYEVSVLLAVAGASANLLARFVDANNFLMLDALGRLSETVAGVTTVLGTMAGEDWGGGQRFALRVAGGAVTCHRDGVQELAAATTLAAGRAGLRSSTTATRFDDFQARSL
jgi:hypothetical protein